MEQRRVPFVHRQVNLKAQQQVPLVTRQANLESQDSFERAFNIPPRTQDWLAESGAADLDDLPIAAPVGGYSTHSTRNPGAQLRQRVVRHPDSPLRDALGRLETQGRWQQAKDMMRGVAANEAVQAIFLASMVRET